MLFEKLLKEAHYGNDQKTLRSGGGNPDTQTGRCHMIIGGCNEIQIAVKDKQGASDEIGVVIS